jgi:DNA polymerase-1
MDADEFVKYLDRVSPAGAGGWRARCPAHPDTTPSLSITTGEAGRILLCCHAGCSVEAILRELGLQFTDLFPTSRGLKILPAYFNAAVSTWLRSDRGLLDAEVRRMWAATTRKGPAVVFRYLDRAGRVLYDKFRPVGGEKTFWRSPGGRMSALYGAHDLPADADRVVIVEGELDLHALRAVGIAVAVSVPDGAGSKVSEALFAPIASIRDIVIATDADARGDDLAKRIAAQVGATRCRRARLLHGGLLFKDANDALRAGWTRTEFDAAFAAAQPMVPKPTKKPESVAASVDTGPYRRVDGRLCRLRHDREGNEIVQPLANFDAEVVEEVAYDDGADTSRVFHIRGALSDGRELPVARVPANDFGSMNWVTGAWGVRAVVCAGQGARDHLRAAVQILSTATSRLVFKHTGWRHHAGEWAYLFHGGAVGANDLAVDLEPPLDRLVLPRDAIDVPEAVSWSLRLLDCGPETLTVPLLGAIYEAPLSFAMSPDFAVWLLGPSGSLKSELAALAQRHFGRFDRKTLPATWTSTENSLESRLFALKDVLAVIDDYAPLTDARAQTDLERRAQRVLRGVGNHSARGRLRADLSAHPDRPPRGLVLCTGEDLPPGSSIQARLVVVPVDRDRLNLPAITELQGGADRLPHAMRGYIEWLRPQLDELQERLPRERERVRGELHRIGSHLRQAEALAHLYLGFDLFLAFAESVGAVTGDRAAGLRERGLDALRSIGERQGQQLLELDPAARFLNVLGTLLIQRRVGLVARDIDPGPDDAEFIGWHDEEFAYLLPAAVRRRVASFLRESGEHWPHTSTALNQALVRRGVLALSPDGRAETLVRVGNAGERRRVLRLPLAVLDGAGLPALSPASPPSPAGDGWADGTVPVEAA